MTEIEQLKQQVAALTKDVANLQRITKQEIQTRLSDVQTLVAKTDANFGLVIELAAHEGIPLARVEKQRDVLFRHSLAHTLTSLENTKPGLASEMAAHHKANFDLPDVQPLFGRPDQGERPPAVADI